MRNPTILRGSACRTWNRGREMRPSRVRTPPSPPVEPEPSLQLVFPPTDSAEEPKTPRCCKHESVMAANRWYASTSGTRREDPLQRDDVVQRQVGLAVLMGLTAAGVADG